MQELVHGRQVATQEVLCHQATEETSIPRLPDPRHEAHSLLSKLSPHDDTESYLYVFDCTVEELSQRRTGPDSGAPANRKTATDLSLYTPQHQLKTTSSSRRKYWPSAVCLPVRWWWPSITGAITPASSTGASWTPCSASPGGGSSLTFFQLPKSWSRWPWTISSGAFPQKRLGL